jgi:hypothetical protein
MSDGTLEWLDGSPVRPDFASEDFAWPEVKDLRPVDALRLLDDVEREARQANRRAEALKRRKAQAKQIALAVLEDYEQDSTKVRTSDGNKVIYSTYNFDVFSVDNEEAFREWAATQSESYFDPTPKLRDSIFLDEMRRRVQDGEPLPPGVKRWTDVRLSRSAAK